MNLSNFNSLTEGKRLFKMAGLVAFLICGNFGINVCKAQSPANPDRSGSQRFWFRHIISRPLFTRSISPQVNQDLFGAPTLRRSTFTSRSTSLPAGFPLRVSHEGNNVEAALPCGFSVFCTQGDAIFGESPGFFGVHGKSLTNDAVFGESDSGFGVRGTSTHNDGVVGESASGFGVVGTHTGSGNTGKLGMSDTGVFGDGSAVGVEGTSFTVGVQGRHKGSTNFGQLGTSSYGVFGSSNSGNGVKGESPNGFGVRGDSTSGYGVVGFSANSDAVVGFGKNGVHGQSNSASDSGVWGENLGGGYGVAGSTGSGIGISGTSANNIGVSGRNTSTNNQGQLGTSSYGVYGSHGSGNAGWLGGSSFGAYGLSSSGFGVYGYSVTGYGVYGISSTFGAAKAGYFSGNVQVSGNLSKGGGSFKIDHPLDPENKYLYHSFVESPDMKNIYDGTIKLDENGEAEVDLPEWFDTLNSDFRYLLTPIGAPAPGLYIADEVQKNRFKIAGGTAGMKVSWQVTGIRQDAYAKKHRIVVEEEKPEIERGFYLHPEAHGQPEEKGVEWARNPEMMKLVKKERSQQQPQEK
jgi:hypothetical protein